MITPIQTRYAGYLFRSRLEARWAVFFDALGLKWLYECEGFDLPSGRRYLPDFKIEFRNPLWVEIKPAHGESDLMQEFIKWAPNNWRATIFNEIPDPRLVGTSNGQYYYDDDRRSDDRPFIWFGGGNEGAPGFDNFYRFCICESCQEIGFHFDGRSARIGCDCDIHADSDKNYTGGHPRIVAAFAKARAARFEYDQRETYLHV